MSFIESIICRHGVVVHPSCQSRIKQKHAIFQRVCVKVVVVRVVFVDLVFMFVRA
jgi:hypothetical protein